MVVTWLLAQPSADEEIEESAQSLWDTTVDAVPRVAVAIAIVVIGWCCHSACDGSCGGTSPGARHRASPW